MDKLNFEDLPSTKTPINADNLNQVQTNVETAIDIPLAKQVLLNSNEFLNKYVKLFTLNFSFQYKSSTCLFELTSVQDGVYDNIYSLNVYYSKTSDGITGAYFKKINDASTTQAYGTQLDGELIAVRESSSSVTVYYKPTTNNKTMTLKILSFSKYGSNSITLYDTDTIIDSLPDGTQYTVEGYMNGAIYVGKVSASMTRMYASSVSVTAAVPDGYNFVQWTHCATVGWISSVYAATPTNQSTMLWNAGTGTNSDEYGTVHAFYLCAKAPVSY